jgi:hypothetical protein
MNGKNNYKQVRFSSLFVFFMLKYSKGGELNA